MRDMFDVVTREGDHIYAPITVFEAVLLQVAVCSSGQSGDFARPNRRPCLIERAFAHSHLDKHDRCGVPRDEVKLAVAATPVARHNDKAAPFQKRRGSVFAGIACLPALGHYG